MLPASRRSICARGEWMSLAGGLENVVLGLVASWNVSG